MKLFFRKPAPLVCRQAVEAVTAYLEGTMPRGDARRFEAHLADCPHCTEYVEQIRATIVVSGSIDAEDLSPAGREALVGVFRAWAAEG